jgi:hypothetical protein
LMPLRYLLWQTCNYCHFRVVTINLFYWLEVLKQFLVQLSPKSVKT